MSGAMTRWGTGALALTWKLPAVIVLTAIGAVAANQLGWNGAETLTHNPDSFGIDLDWVLALVAGFVSAAVLYATHRIARYVLWLTVPIMAYSAIVLGAWNGFASGFDSIRLAAVQHHFANAYALRHMSPEGFESSCDDRRITLTDDAKVLCTGRHVGDQR